MRPSHMVILVCFGSLVTGCLPGASEGNVDAGDSRPSPESDVTPRDAGTSDAGTTDAGRAGPTSEECFGSLIDPDRPTPNYDQYRPILNPDCTGTDHQNITDIEQVAFIGDIVTLGSLAMNNDTFYRTQVAAALVTKFDIEAPVPPGWHNWSEAGGGSQTPRSGAFVNCATVSGGGADLLSQIEYCDRMYLSREQRTLFVLTTGHWLNRIAAAGGNPEVTTATLWARIDENIQGLEDTLAWIYTSGRFPNGVSVVFANVYDFTDGTSDFNSCSTWQYENWDDPGMFNKINAFVNEEYMRLAVSYQADMVFLAEQFCGHGYRRNDANARCDRGPDAELWVGDDAVCSLPNARGHAEISNLFLNVID